MEEKTLKRVVRAMNSILNLYDTDFPEPLIDKLMEGVVEVAGFLKLTKIAILDEETGDILKYVMPEDYNKWIENRGKKKGEGQ